MAEHRQRVGAATRAVTLGDLQALVDDLPPDAAPLQVRVTKSVPNVRRVGRPDRNTYLVIEPATDPTNPGALSLSVYVSTDYGGGLIVFAGDGTTKRVSLPS